MTKTLKYYLNLKFSDKILIFFLIIISITVLLISSANYIVSNILITRYATNYSAAISSQITDNFSSRIKSIEETNFIKYQNIQAFNAFPTTLESTPIQNRLLYQSAVDELLYSVDYYKSICFIDNNNFLYTSGPVSDFMKQEAFSEKQITEIRRAWGKCIWAKSSDSRLLLKRALYHLQSGAYIGCMIIEINSRYLSDVYAQSIASYGGSIVVFNAELDTILSGGEEFTAIALDAISNNASSVKFHNEKYITTVSESSDGQWFLIHIIRLSQLTNGLIVIGYWIIIISIIIFLLAIVLAYLISNTITQNLNLLLDSMKQLSLGHFDKRIEPMSHDEFGIIIDNFNIMAQKIKELMEKISLEQEQKQQVKYQMLEFQYDSLRARLNPHFLYNVLDSISNIAKLRDEYEISEWICLLSDMLRESIGQTKRLVPLEIELSYVKKYTTLYQMMYKDRVNILYNTDLKLSQILVPTFILQPIVENAIVHGIECKSGPGIIQINSYSQHNLLILEVKDNGNGIPEDVLSKILTTKLNINQDNTPYTQRDRHTKVGLASILERIQLLYGPDYGLKIISQTGKGTKIQIFLPLNS